jgi:hypothetical protein
MECGRSPLVSIARVSAGRGAADRNSDRHEEAATEAATGFKRRSVWATIVNLVNRTQTSLRSVRRRAGLDGSGSCSSEGQLARKKNLESGARRISTFNGTFDGVTRRHRGGSDGLRAGWLLVWRRSTSEWRVIQQLSGRAHRRPGCTGGQCTRGCLRDRVGLSNGGNIAPTNTPILSEHGCERLSHDQPIVFSRP